MCLKEINFHLRSNEVGHIQGTLMAEQFAKPTVKSDWGTLFNFFWNCLLLDSSVFCSGLTGFYKHPRTGIYNANTDRTIALLGPTIHSSNWISYFFLLLSYVFWHCNLQKNRSSCVCLLGLEILFYFSSPFSESKARFLCLPFFFFFRCTPSLSKAILI